MSWQATAWALQQRTGSSATKLTLLGLANYADENGVCWPTQERLAAETEQSVDTVQRRIKQLAALGLVRVERRDGARGQWAGKIYFLAIPVAELSKPQNAVRSKPEQPDRKLRSPCRTEPGDHAALSPTTIPQALRHKPSIEPPIEHSLLGRAREDAPGRQQAFRGKHEGVEVVQNRIAQRIGERGWLLLGEMSTAERARLTTLERRGALDDATLATAVSAAAARAPP